MDYKLMSEEIIANIGGAGNVKYVTHCVTRLRFVLKNDKLVNKDNVNNIAGVLGSTFGAGQYQIILGKNLQPVFEAVTANYDFEVGDIVDENLDDDVTDKGPFWKRAPMELINFLSACVTPVVPGLTVVGLIKVVLLLVSLAVPSVTEGQTYIAINNIVNTMFYFLPVYVAYGTALRLHCTPIYAMIVVCFLLHPNMIEMLGAEGGLTIFGIAAYPASYSSSFMPAILSTIVVAYTEKFLNKVVPGMFKGVFVGAATVVFGCVVAILFVGPIGFFLGNYFVEFLVWLQRTVGPFAMAGLGCFLPFIIMTGMHSVFGPVMTQSIATLGYEGFLRPTQFVHNVAEGGACFGVALKTKNPELRSEALSSCVGAIFAGVSEPAIYGINIRLKKPIYGVCAGGAVGGFIAGMFGVKAFAYGNPSALALPIYGETMIFALIAVIAAFVVAAVVAYFSGFEDIPVKK